MKYLPWLAVAILAALIGRALFPRTVTVTETIQLPAKTDTLEIPVERLREVERVVYRDRPVFSTDTVTLVEVRYVTVPDTLTSLHTWYLKRLQAGSGLTDPTIVSADLIKYDGALTRIQSVEQYPVTLGPVTDILADSTGIHVNFGTWPEPKKGCGFGCRLQWALGGLAAGVILWEVAR